MQRERFEAWAAERGINLARFDRYRYADNEARLAREAWQAACPEGWQAVPIEADSDMLDRAWDGCGIGGGIRPTRTSEQIAEDDAIKAMMRATFVMGRGPLLYGRENALAMIYAAIRDGKIPGVTIAAAPKPEDV